jgi:hypothetical protein
MTDRERDLQALCRRLGQERHKLRVEVRELAQANAELRVERDATDAAFGEAIDLLLEQRR